jgi:hypothetical protein
MTSRAQSDPRSSTPQTTGESRLAAPPSMRLLKDGGAIQGIDKKFAANPVTGTGSMTVFAATPEGHTAPGRELALSSAPSSGDGLSSFRWS